MYCNWQLEKLSIVFSQNIAIAGNDPFKSDQVVTQSRTMELYLNKTLADLRQIAVNIDYLQPRAAIQRIFHQAGVHYNDYALNETVILWKIYALLPEFEQKYPVLSNYIRGFSTYYF